MQDFFKSMRFKILLALLLVLFAFMLRATLSGGASTIVSQVFGIVTTPFSDLSAGISNKATHFFTSLVHASEISEENDRLREELRNMNEKMADYEQYKHENEYLREFLGVKEQNPDFEFEAAEVIQRDPNDRFGAFTINKGSLAGIEYLDPVITADGLVGRITEVGLTYAKVSTILDVSLDVGCYDVRTRDTGIISGDVELAAEGGCKMSLIPKGSVAEADDIIRTNGIGGIFPADLIVGKILRVEMESHGKSLYAVVEPSADINSLTDVLVITSFLGQENSLGDVGQ